MVEVLFASLLSGVPTLDESDECLFVSFCMCQDADEIRSLN